MKTLSFTKMHGLGNDFVVIDDFKKIKSQHTPVNSKLAQKLCDRHFGVGADQLLWIKNPKSKTALARMEIYNSDGSKAEMCGNGIRAVALYLMDHHLKKQTHLVEMKIETLAGIIPIKIKPNRQVEVALAIPKIGRRELISVCDQSLRFYEVNVGNDHAVIFVENVDQVPLEKWGPVIEKHAIFPKHTNVEFVEVINQQTLKVRVWERGTGVTLACGSGACASAVAALAIGRVEGSLKVHLPGGVLDIHWEGAGQKVLMEGPATEVFSGIFF